MTTLGRLGQRAFTVDALRDSWRTLWANDQEDGSVSYGVARFAVDPDAGLTTLATQLAGGKYSPKSLTEVQVTMGDKIRTLHIPPVEDRIVARAMLVAVTPFIDEELGSCAFAYRPGLGVTDAVQEVVRLREEGLVWVLRTDIRDCFPSIPADLALRRFSALIPDEHLAQLMEAFLLRTFRTSSGRYLRVEGLPQGCPLSPMLANLVLVDVDRALLDRGFPTVRYGDDLVVACASADEAWEAARVTSKAVEEMGMELGADKTEVMSFEQGFAFLGDDFGPRYPPHLPDLRVREPEEKVLYVGLQGGRVRIAQGRLLVESKDDVGVIDVPTTQVGRIVCFGSVGLSAGARSWALANDVDIVLASRSGNYLGTMLSHGRRYRPARLRAQLAMDESAQATAIGRAMVAGKIRKQQVVLQRANRPAQADDVRDVVGQLSELLRMVPDATNSNELMGLEGAAARFYFPCLGALMPEELRFTLRSRQPPMDVPNAALSFLYTILLGECVTALHAAGLDPAIGVLHSDQDNRPSLALDLMEEFRPYIVDQVVLHLARRKTLTADCGRPEPSKGILLTKAGREAVLDGYEVRMLQSTSGALPEFTGTLRRHVYRQAQRLRASIMDHNEPWTGLSWR